MTLAPGAVRSWPEFRRALRDAGVAPFAAYPRFSRAVFVGGCQRSGSTLMSGILMDSGAFVHYRSTRTIELDSAVVLAGLETPPGEGRYLFHTTYLNGDVSEYWRLGADARLVWMIRRPESVVYSMLHNWSRRALDTLFIACGRSRLTAREQARYRYLGGLGVGRVRRACSAYAGKTAQVIDLADRLGPDRLLVVDYDDLVTDPRPMVERVCQFAEVGFAPRLTDRIHRDSLGKAQRLSRHAVALTASIAAPVYASARAVGHQLAAGRALHRS